jgi:hypothetical protein
MSGAMPTLVVGMFSREMRGMATRAWPWHPTRENRMTYHYTAQFAAVAPPLEADWESPLWQRAEEARIGNFHPAGSEHRPLARAKLLYDQDSLFLGFRVDDRYVVATRTRYQQSVCKDSCVEFFVQPKPGGGYFNFEINCGGTLLLYYIEDARRTAQGFARFTPVAVEHGGLIQIWHSLPAVVFPEQPGPVAWQIACRIPLGVLAAYAGPLGSLSGQTWRGNFFKCADESSHPHWASWAPIGEELNFHQPARFAPIHFAPCLPEELT